MNKASQLRAQHEGQLGRSGKEAIVYMAEKTPCRVIVRLEGRAGWLAVGWTVPWSRWKYLLSPAERVGPLSSRQPGTENEVESQ